MKSQLRPVGRAPTTSPRMQTLQASSCHVHGGQALTRRETFAALASGALATSAPLFTPGTATASIMACPGLNGYALSKCLKEARKAAAANDDAEGTDAGDDVQSARLKYRQFEQPGELVTLPSGVQYREIDTGSGRQAELGDVCEVSYVVYRLSSGAYFKYSSGGTPVFLWALGFGFEGQRDEGEVYRFRLGEALSLPAAATPAVVGMREGGRRRILIPPEYGWVSDKVGPQPVTFGGQRRLAAHRDEPLLLEVLLSRVRPVAQGDELLQGDKVRLRAPFKFPAPPSPFGLPSAASS